MSLDYNLNYNQIIWQYMQKLYNIFIYINILWKQTLKSGLLKFGFMVYY